MLRCLLAVSLGFDAFIRWVEPYLLFCHFMEINESSLVSLHDWMLSRNALSQNLIPLQQSLIIRLFKKKPCRSPDMLRFVRFSFCRNGLSILIMQKLVASAVH
jgi:hypothetical protein